MRALSVLAVSLVLLIGCARGTSQIKPVATFMTMAPGNALIKVGRPYNFEGSGLSAGITDNGDLVGKLAVDGYLVWERPAGEMKINIYRSRASPLVVQVEAGQQYEFAVYRRFGEGFVLEAR